MVKREQYLKKLRLLKDEQIIKVIVGVRRCGKSTLLEMFRDELVDGGTERNRITFLNFEEPEKVGNANDWREIYDRILGGLLPDRMNYIFLDEVQLVPGFEKMVDGLHVKKNVDLYITGSNARFLSSELATLLSGRYVEIRMLPFSFAEFASAFGEAGHPDDLFQDYVNYGSFPKVADFLVEGKTEIIHDYLTGIFNTVLIKDVMLRRGAGNVRTVTNITRFMLDNIGNISSPKNISDAMTSNNQTVSRPTVTACLSALQEGYLLYPIRRYDVKGKNLLQNSEKYYTVDVGIRRTVLGANANRDSGRILENIVCLELLRREHVVRIGRAGNKEVDFVTQDKSGDTAYFQVAYTVRDENTLERELASLKIADNHPKYLITMDPEERNLEGVRQVNAVKWLLGKYG
jgi:predicted AAA+ superfamily ATPase